VKSAVKKPQVGAVWRNVIGGLLSGELPALNSHDKLREKDHTSGAAKMLEKEAMKLFTALAIVLFSVAAFGEAPADKTAGQPVSSEADARMLRLIASRAKQLGLACRLFAMDNNGSYPASLFALFPDYLGENTIFGSPSSPNEPLGFAYFGGKESDPPSELLLCSKDPTPDGKWVVLYKDFTFEVVSEKPKPLANLPKK